MLRKVACQVGLPALQNFKSPGPKIKKLSLGRGREVSAVLCCRVEFGEEKGLFEIDEVEAACPGEL